MRQILPFIAFFMLSPLASSGEGNRLLAFPHAADGRQVLTVDLHTHSVFSDGRVWPSIRVEEGEREGLTAIAITEHLEWQPHADDIPHPDRNRAFEIASERAANGNLQVFNGAEITRGPDIGHINAVFLNDANQLLTANPPSASTGEGFAALADIGEEASHEQGMQALREAQRQGAFIFLNHPAWVGLSPSGRGELTRFQRKAIKDGLIHGVEVGNGGTYSHDAFKIALKYDLAILGTSDVHGLTAWDYAQPGEPLLPGGRGARTVTLVLSDDAGGDGIKAALFNRETVALNDNQLFGRKEELRSVLEGALSFSVGDQQVSHVGDSTVYQLHIHNHAPIPLSLENRSREVFSNTANQFPVPPGGTVTIDIAELESPGSLDVLKMAVLNAFIEPGESVVIEIRRQAE